MEFFKITYNLNKMNQKIYKIQIQMTCQADCNRVKKICVDYGLPIWSSKVAFIFNPDDEKYFAYSDNFNCFFVYPTRGLKANKSVFKPITIEQFLELLNEK